MVRRVGYENRLASKAMVGSTCRCRQANSYRAVGQCRSNVTVVQFFAIIEWPLEHFQPLFEDSVTYDLRGQRDYLMLTWNTPGEQDSD